MCASCYCSGGGWDGGDACGCEGGGRGGAGAALFWGESVGRVSEGFLRVYWEGDEGAMDV